MESVFLIFKEILESLSIDTKELMGFIAAILVGVASQEFLGRSGLSNIIGSYFVKFTKSLRENSNSKKIALGTARFFQILSRFISSLFFRILLSASSIVLIVLAIGSALASPGAVDGSREISVVLMTLSLILVCCAVTIYFTPSRMTVIAGVALGLIGAVLLVEGFLLANDFMTQKVSAG